MRVSCHMNFNAQKFYKYLLLKGEDYVNTYNIRRY